MAIKVKLNLKGINAVMKGEGAQADIARRVKRAAAEAGEGFEAVIKPARYVARGFVATTGVEGAKRQARDNVLERSLDAMR